MTYLDQVDHYLNTHYGEASAGLVDKPPSRLCRGEGTEKHYYIFKIDLARSTQLLYGRRAATYLKLAHTFLSTVDRVLVDFGADRKQTEYAGDSVLAYFPDTVPAYDVLIAAAYCRAAVGSLKKLDQTLGGLNLRSKIVLHYAPLVVSNIGPRGDSVLTAIGHPIHQVAKLEKEVSENSGRATTAFHEQLEGRQRRYLSALYAAPPPAPITPPPLNVDSTAAIVAAAMGVTRQPARPAPLAALGAGALRPPANLSLADALLGFSMPAFHPAPLQPQPVAPRVVTGYGINWGFLYPDLGIPVGG